MAIWMEIRCDKRGDGRDGRTRCWSDDNSGPTGMADDTQRSVLDTLRAIHAEALAENWRQTRDGWICPGCIEHEANNVATASAAA